MKRHWRRLLLLLLAALPVAAQAASDYGRFHALIIANQNYRHLNKLETPLADAKAVAEVLKEQYGFTVNLLLDKTRDEIMLALTDLRKIMTSENSSLLIYYAGHGDLDKQTETGYWQPVNAEKDNTVYWIANEDITRQLKALQARHVLVVVDSCYSGTIFRHSGAQLAPGMSQDEWLKRMFQKRSRTALTSGSEEPVADGGGGGHSVFARAFLTVLRGNVEILDGRSLFDRIKKSIVNNAEQTPHYANINKSDINFDSESGDFIFVPKELQEVIFVKQDKKPDISFAQGQQKQRGDEKKERELTIEELEKAMRELQLSSNIMHNMVLESIKQMGDNAPKKGDTMTDQTTGMEQAIR